MNFVVRPWCGWLVIDQKSFNDVSTEDIVGSGSSHGVVGAVQSDGVVRIATPCEVFVSDHR